MRMVVIAVVRLFELADHEFAGPCRTAPVRQAQAVAAAPFAHSRKNRLQARAGVAAGGPRPMPADAGQATAPVEPAKARIYTARWLARHRRALAGADRRQRGTGLKADF